MHKIVSSVMVSILLVPCASFAADPLIPKDDVPVERVQAVNQNLLEECRQMLGITEADDLGGSLLYRIRRCANNLRHEQINRRKTSQTNRREQIRAERAAERARLRFPTQPTRLDLKNRVRRISSGDTTPAEHIRTLRREDHVRHRVRERRAIRQQEAGLDIPQTNFTIEDARRLCIIKRERRIDVCVRSYMNLNQEQNVE